MNGKAHEVVRDAILISTGERVYAVRAPDDKQGQMQYDITFWRKPGQRIRRERCKAIRIRLLQKNELVGTLALVPLQRKKQA